jgi:hypothetical protein
MRQDTKVLLESQRPMLAAEPHGNAIQDLADPVAPRVQLELLNRGLSPAYDVVYETWIELLKFPFQDFTSSAEHHKAPERTVMYPHHAPAIITISITKGITKEQLAALRQLHLYVCIRLRVEYRDAFSPRRYAEFGVCVLHDGLGFLPKYNDAG